MLKLSPIFCIFLMALVLSACTTVSTTLTTAQPENEAEVKFVIAEKPILQIDTGGHMAKINDIFFTQDGQSLISVSDDKTVRIWDINSGQTVRVLRGQIGLGNKGKIYAAALSHDNRLLAIGGWLHSECAGRCGNIHLIDLQSGEVLRLFKGHDNVILSLTFSANDRFLVSGSSDGTARIWDVASGESLHTLTGHHYKIYAVAFSPDGSKVVTGSDDMLKLWDSTSGKHLANLNEHDDKVLSVAFTPDGAYILSGSSDKAIRLWDGYSGVFIKTLAKQSSTVDSISVTSDGKKVMTGAGLEYGYGGKHKKNNVFSIPSGERLANFSEHTNPVLATAISPDGAIAATGGGNNNEIYLWDIQTGKVKQRMVGKGEQIWSVGFAKDGKSIAWGRVPQTGNIISTPLEQAFHLKNSQGGFNLTLGEVVVPDAATRSSFLRAVKSAGHISITTPDSKINPDLLIKKNDQIIHTITRDDTTGHNHRSLTITPDGRTAISGASHGVLTAYDAASAEKLHDFVGHTSDVWAVAVSPDSHYLVSGSDDQTVKLWETQSGKLLLTIFHGVDNEWVAWTLDGFYTASPKGNAYVGYHINRGEDKAADYVGLDQIGKHFYRPDLVAKTVQGGHEEEIATELARIGSIDTIIANGLPPEVRLLSESGEKSNQRNFTLRLAIKALNGGIGSVRYLINGVEVASATATSRGEALPGLRRSGVIEEDELYLEKPLTLPDGENNVGVVICNQDNSICSRKVKLTRHVDDPRNKQPSLHLLAIGITDYRDRSLQLAFAHEDAKALSTRMAQQGQGLYKNVLVTTLLNENATTTNIKNAFDQIAAQVEANDVFVIFLAGHGMPWQGDYHFIPWEATYENSELLAKASLSEKQLTDLLKRVPTSKRLVILDSCSAGLFASGLAGDEQFAMLATRGIEEKSAIDRLMRATGRHVLAATTDRDQALEGHEGHGVFTWALLEGLKGHASRRHDEGSISLDELGDFVRTEVPRITMKKWGFEQIPMRVIQGDPFPVACKVGYDQPGCNR